jgi:hypothetical protein
MFGGVKIVRPVGRCILTPLVLRRVGRRRRDRLAGSGNGWRGWVGEESVDLAGDSAFEEPQDF